MSASEAIFTVRTGVRLIQSSFITVYVLPGGAIDLFLGIHGPKLEVNECILM